MARSVAALFASAPPDGPRPGDLVWEEVEEPPTPDPATADADALRGAVTDFLASPPLEREGKARTVRIEAAALRAANALEVLADAVERLTREAGDPPDEACLAIARSLLPDGVAARIAARLAAARNDERRDELTTTSLRLGEGMIEALADGLAETEDRFARRAFVDTITAFGERAMTVIQHMVDDRRWFVARNAAAILGGIGGARSVELLTATLAHADARVRREALVALGKVGGDDAGMLVIRMIDDPDPDVRLAAVMAAGELKVGRALGPLLAIVEGKSDHALVVVALNALGQIGNPGAVAAVEKRAVTSFFSRPPTEVRIAAYRALHRIGNPHAKSLLVQAIDDRNDAVKSAVRQLLEVR